MSWSRVLAKSLGRICPYTHLNAFTIRVHRKHLRVEEADGARAAGLLDGFDHLKGNSFQKN
jgi:hypothetical protein